MPAPHHSSFFTGQMPFLPPNQQHQSTDNGVIEATDMPELSPPPQFNGCFSGKLTLASSPLVPYSPVSDKNF